MEPDPDLVQRLTRATCAELHRRALESGYLVRRYRNPEHYHAKQVWPIVYAAVATGLIRETE